MRLSKFLAPLAMIVAAALLSLIAAGFAVSALEQRTEIGVRQALDLETHNWAEVEADGLQVVLTGTAPSEIERFQAISVTGSVVDASRIIDQIAIKATADLAPPHFSAEILRNDSGISAIGLIPASTDRDELLEVMRKIAGGLPVADLLETGNYPVPEGWNDAMSYALTALARLPRSKISVDAGRIDITANADSEVAGAALEDALRRAKPPSLNLKLAISTPRPVITPFTLRFLTGPEGGQFDACSADTETAAQRIEEAARNAGLTGSADCIVGMGVPTPKWADAAELAIDALARLGAGSVTFSDADITLVAAEGTEQPQFDRVVGELEAALPEVFALHAVLPQPDDATSGPPEFTATLSPEGLVQLRGRVGDEELRQMADSLARASFGSENVYTAARVVEDLPGDWPLRVLTGLEALSMLVNGAVTVEPHSLSLRGTSEIKDAKARISSLMAERLGEGENFALDITYRAPPDPEEVRPSPDMCEEMLSQVQTGDKIAFEPGSATIAAESLGVMNRIADILKDCGDIRVEIQGHTDSQGRESMNLELSQLRAQSVLDELRSRRIPTASYKARGYGESTPIADNGTEEGREANRRIEFRLIRPEPIQDRETGLDNVEAEQTEGEAAQETNQ